MVKKIGVFIMILGLFFVGMPRYNVNAQTYDNNVSVVNTINMSQVETVENLASPDLEGKQEVDIGVYRLYNDKGITLDYNVYNGIYILNGMATTNGNIDIMPLQQYNDLIYTSTLNILSGQHNNSLWFKVSASRAGVSYMEIVLYSTILERTVTNQLPNYVKPMIVFNAGYEYNNLQFKLQLEQGDTVSPYIVPLQPRIWHERYLAYIEGYDTGSGAGYDEGFESALDTTNKESYNQGWASGQLEGYRKGESVGYAEGYDIGYDDGERYGYDNGLNNGYSTGYYEGLDVGYTDGSIDGYNKGINETDATGFVGLLTAVFGGLGTLLSIELLPGIYIGAIIAVPLVFGIIFFILGKRKGD